MHGLDDGEIAALAALEQDIRSPRRAEQARNAQWPELLAALRFVADREVEQVAWEELMLTKLPPSRSLSLGTSNSCGRTVLLLELHRKLTSWQAILRILSSLEEIAIWTRSLARSIARRVLSTLRSFGN